MKYIVISIDGRGSGMQGWKYKEPIYGNLGTVEVEDQLEAMRSNFLRIFYPRFKYSSCF